MYFDQPPQTVQTSLFTTMPDKFRRKGVASAWADANKRGVPVDSFIEGPAFDAEGNLHIVDIPFGRIFRISSQREWTCLIEYDGEPNGLKIHPDGRILVADYRNGLMALDPATNHLTPLLNRRNSESFKGVNDLTIASSGDIYFTDRARPACTTRPAVSTASPPTAGSTASSPTCPAPTAWSSALMKPSCSSRRPATTRSGACP
jgi:gluconolactonase